VLWTRLSLGFFFNRPAGPPPNSGRVATYLALAQYRAALAADAAGKGLPQAERPSLAGAVSGASVVVLKSLYPQYAEAIDAELAAQRAAPPGTVASGGDWRRDFAAGEAIGRSVGAAVLAQAATDNVGVAPLPTPLLGPGYWVSSGAPTVKGNFGARPFFLATNTEINAPPPPAFGSPEYLAALAAVRAYAAGRTPEQVAITIKWVPFSDPLFNREAADLLERYHVDDLESARILAYANAASFDALIGCFETKFVYWYVRPTQADPTITLATGLPNHPSYPSAHSCSAGAFQSCVGRCLPPGARGPGGDGGRVETVTRAWGPALQLRWERGPGPRPAGGSPRAGATRARIAPRTRRRDGSPITEGRSSCRPRLAALVGPLGEEWPAGLDAVPLRVVFEPDREGAGDQAAGHPTTGAVRADITRRRGRSIRCWPPSRRVRWTPRHRAAATRCRRA
jgi:hypothetical protein